MALDYWDGETRRVQSGGLRRPSGGIRVNTQQGPVFKPGPAEALENRPQLTDPDPRQPGVNGYYLPDKDADTMGVPRGSWIPYGSEGPGGMTGRDRVDPNGVPVGSGEVVARSEGTYQPPPGAPTTPPPDFRMPFAKAEPPPGYHYGMDWTANQLFPDDPNNPDTPPLYKHGEGWMGMDDAAGPGAGTTGPVTLLPQDGGKWGLDQQVYDPNGVLEQIQSRFDMKKPGPPTGGLQPNTPGPRVLPPLQPQVLQNPLAEDPSRPVNLGLLGKPK